MLHLSDDDKSMATEQIEPLPKVPAAAEKASLPQTKQTQQQKLEKQERPVKPKTKGNRAKGRVSTPERKPIRKEPVYVPREEVKKKKGSPLPFTQFRFLSLMLFEYIHL